MNPFSLPHKMSALARGMIIALTLVLAVPLGTAAADARAGFGSSFGSRGGRTFSAPPVTSTAPRWSAPIQRSETPRPSFGAPSSPGFSPAPRFGFGSGFLGGLVGGGLLGLMMGHGLFGGLYGVSSFFGLLFQLALIGGLVWLALRFFRGPAFAGAGPGGLAGLGGAMNRRGSAPGGSRPGRDEVGIGPNDFRAFEQALGSVQQAYSREDLAGLSRLSTPEMVRYFQSDLDEMRRRGLRNDIGDVRLLQGDLAESWREGGADFATVAMRFGLRDRMVERASGRVVSDEPSEATEVWTFRRDRGGPWLLSAIQQAA